LSSLAFLVSFVVFVFIQEVYPEWDRKTPIFFSFFIFFLFLAVISDPGFPTQEATPATPAPPEK
jgi:hypothetical protein